MEEENNEYFAGEFEEMDLSDLHDKIFLVACSSGDRNKPKYIPETISGPFNFYEMIEVVGNFYGEQQLHAKAMVPSKSMGTAPQILDENTIDFIEARYMDLIADDLLGGDIMNAKEFTCKAGFIEEETEETEEEV
jgi:hypothetical protein